MSKAEEFFADELNSISNDELRNFVKNVLDAAPTYFWVAPSSSTGKWHPSQSNGTGGLVRHTRSIVYFSTILCRAYGVGEYAKDIVTAACLCHDLLKYGQPMQKHTTKYHDKEGADFVFYMYNKLSLEEKRNLPEEMVVEICRAIAHHMGRWTVETRAKRFPDDYTTTELLVHLSDMCSAGREVSLDFLQENLIA